METIKNICSEKMIGIIDNKKYALDLKNLLDIYGVDGGDNKILLGTKNNEENNTFFSILKQNNNSNKIEVNYYENGKISSHFLLEISESLNEKNAYKTAIYQLFKEKIFKNRLNWGILTGIRPVKLYRSFRDELGEDFADNNMRDIYKISEDKLSLVKSIYEEQNPYVEKIKDTLALYINIPFCPSRCNYCSFFSVDLKKNSNKLASYVESLIIEIKSAFEMALDSGYKFSSIYFGGGTPGVLNEKHIDKIFGAIYSKIDIKDLYEISFELGRPELVNPEKLQTLRKNGVNRISINPQTLKAETLKKIGRNHSVDDFYKAFNLSKNEGFEIINCDLIMGLEGENIEDFALCLENIISLSPENITIHPLAIKTGSNLMNNDKTKIETFNFDEVMGDCIKLLKENSYEPYYLYRQKRSLDSLENIGFTKKGKGSYYNIGMMDLIQSVIGVGAGASSKILTGEKIAKRIAAPKSLELYDKYVKGL